MMSIVIENSDENVMNYLRNKRRERAEANYRILKDAHERLRKKLEELLKARLRSYDEKEEEIKELGAQLRSLEERLDRAAEDLQKDH